MKRADLCFPLVVDGRGAIIVVSGIPGAGKSTAAPMLARHFLRGVHVEADRLQEMIVRGGRWPDEAGDEGQAQLRLRGRNACLLARSFCDAGFVAVVDDIVIGERLPHYAGDLAPYPWSLVQLLPALEVVQERHRGRTASSVAAQWPRLDAEARATPGGLCLDTSALTPEETVAAILPGLWTEGAMTSPRRAPPSAGTQRVDG